MRLSDLPSHLLILIFKDLSLSEIIELCIVNSDLNEKLCWNDEFWYQRYIQQYDLLKRRPLIWKEAYHQRSNTQVYQLYAFLSPEMKLSNLVTILFQVHDIKNISSGYEHHLILDDQGQVWSFGSNKNGRLGFGTHRDRPTLIPNLPEIKRISAGHYHSLILDSQGKVYGFGRNIEGQLGLKDKQDRTVPTLLPGLPKIKRISAGWSGNLFLSEKGQVYRSGRSGTTNPYILISNLPKIKQISAGQNHNLLLSEEGQVYAFGANQFGELGYRGGGQAHPTLIQNIPKMKQISAGENYSLILSEEEGQVYAFGKLFSLSRTFKIPTLISPTGIRIKQISAGKDRNLFLSEDNQLYSYDLNASGELNFGLNVPCPDISKSCQITTIEAGMGFNHISVQPWTPVSTIQTLHERNWIRDIKTKSNVTKITDIQGNTYRIKGKFEFTSS